MCWEKAKIRKERQQAYFDAVLITVSELGGNVSRKQLIKEVRKIVSEMGDVAWHVDRMVATMIRGKSLVRVGDRLLLKTSLGAQEMR